jgi:hypothetical protein
MFRKSQLIHVFTDKFVSNIRLKTCFRSATVKNFEVPVLFPQELKFKITKTNSTFLSVKQSVISKFYIPASRCVSSTPVLLYSLSPLFSHHISILRLVM